MLSQAWRVSSTGTKRPVLEAVETGVHRSRMEIGVQPEEGASGCAEEVWPEDPRASERMLCVPEGMRTGDGEGQEEGVGIAGQRVSSGGQQSPQGGKPRLRARNAQARHEAKPGAPFCCWEVSPGRPKDQVLCQAPPCRTLQIPVLSTDHTPSPAPVGPALLPPVLQLSVASIP